MRDDSNRSQGKTKTRITIGTRLLLSFLAVVLLVSLTRTATSFVVQNRLSHDNSLLNLATITSLKEGQVNLWLALLQTNLTSTLNNTDFRTNASSILLENAPLDLNQPVTEEARGVLTGFFKSLIDQNHLFEDLALVDLQGKVFVTTIQTPSNLSLIESEWDTFSKAQNGYYTSPLFLEKGSSSQAAAAILTSIPVSSEKGSQIGFLVGRANINNLENILADRSGLGMTGQTFLVGSTGSLLIQTFQNNQQIPIGAQLTNQGILEAQKLMAGSASYTNDWGSKVYGAFRWNPGLQAFIFSEQEQGEALSTATEPILINFFAAVLAFTLAVIAAILVTRSITFPITNLVHVATQIAAGNLDVRAKDLRQDEIGVLGQALNTMTDQLRSSILNLEQRVNDRTRELKNRTIQIQVASEIARDVAQATNLEDVLNRAVNLIRDKFGFYHAGIFLIDESNEFAVLKAATGEAGKALLDKKHKLQVGETGLVGFAAGKGQPRISMDVNTDTAHFRNPLLPLTKSELALPLKTSDRVIGVLDVQSTELSAFSQDEVSTLQTMADQLAVAIEKTRLLQQYRENLEELEATYKQYTRQGWSDFISQSKKPYSLRFRNSRIEALDGPEPESRQALMQNTIVKTEIMDGDIRPNRDFSSLAVPIKLRGQSLGVLLVKFQSNQINPETSKLIETISNRLALALENARLLEQIQRQAERDHIVSEITTKVRASNDIDLILQTAIKELGRSLGVSKASIQLRSRQEIEAAHHNEPEVNHLGLAGATDKADL
jgi:GAF domain-containing protein/HAMP domain-containing protein